MLVFLRLIPLFRCTQQEDTLANEWNAGEEKDKELLEDSLELDSDALHNEATDPSEGTVLDETSLTPSQEDAPAEEQAAEKSAEGDAPAEPLSVSDQPAEEPLPVDFEETDAPEQTPAEQSVRQWWERAVP